MPMSLNARARRYLSACLAEAERLRVAVCVSGGGTQIVDCGVDAPGGLEAGRRLAEICLADLGQVRFVAGNASAWPGPAVQVTTDHPVAACMASQYAGWQISEGKFFAMGSGPMRAARGKEPLFDDIGHREQVEEAVGVLESGKLPPESVCQAIAAACGVTPDRLTLLVARTASLAGSVQVVARSVETALHKLHELGFPLASVESGYGIAPLPPVAGDDLAAIGRTNDAVLYGGEVTLWMRHEDEAALADLAARLPSSASRDFGRPFAEIFAAAGGDFYQIDPMLFSPAVVTLVNLHSGRTHHGGQLRPDVLRASFEG